MADRKISLARVGQYLEAKITRLGRLREQGRPLTAAAARNAVLENLENSFAKSESPDGVPWAASCGGTKGPGEVLIETHRMKDGAIAAAEQAVMKDDVMAVPFDQTTYGVFHQTGDKGMPERKWYGLREEQVKEIAQAAAREVVRALMSPNA